MYGEGAGGGTGRRGDRRAGATRLSWSARCIRTTPRPRRGRRLRAQPAAPEHRPHRSLPAALARQRAARRDARRRSRRCSRPGKIRHYGVSNLDLADMQELWALAGGNGGADQPGAVQPVRGAASNGTCCPGCASGAFRSWRIRRSSRRGCCAIAGSSAFAQRHGMTPAQAALAWLLAQERCDRHSEDQ